MTRSAATIALLCLLLPACAKPAIPYYWDGYSASLYNLKKNPGDAALEEHKRVLVNIIEESNKKAFRVPPGVCGEYGYILVSEGNVGDGFKYLDMEAQIYPESKVFVERVKEQVKKKSAAGEVKP